MSRRRHRVTTSKILPARTASGLRRSSPGSGITSCRSRQPNGKTLQEARDKLIKAMQQARAGIPVPDESWRLGLYLEYWLENFVKRNRRPATYNLYEMIARLYLIPGLGKN